MNVEPARRRAMVEQVEDGIRYTLPPRRQAAQIIFAIIWLGPWTFGFLAGMYVLLRHDTKFQMPFAAVWLLFWTYGGLAIFYGLLSQIIGRERVTLSPTGTLRIQRRVLGFEPVREYAAQMIANLRMSPLPQGFFSRSRRGWSAFDDGPIAFDYGAKTQRFGAGLDAAEAEIVAGEIRRHYGF